MSGGNSPRWTYDIETCLVENMRDLDCHQGLVFNNKNAGMGA